MKTLKYSYSKVIQQNYGQGFEDVSEYETRSNFNPIEMSNKLNNRGKTESLLTHDLREYLLMGYPTRVVSRKVKNSVS